MPNLTRDSRILDDAARALARFENEVRLVGRAAPSDVAREVARVVGEFSRGKKVGLGDARGTPVSLDATRRSLGLLGATLAGLGPLGELHAARARELELEARLVEALGTGAVAALAAERFPGPPPSLAEPCDAFVADALRAPPAEPGIRHRSDDFGDAKSLVVRLAARARELGIAIRIDVRRDQLATAATGHGIVCVRPGVLLSATAAERITWHELLAHALPRARARHAPWALLAVGTRGAGDEEEGRAVLVEERAGLLDAERRRSLALRHRSALGVRAGSEPTETLRDLTALGAPLVHAAELALRAHRGGGLGRELVYLPSYFMLKRAFTVQPGLETWFERGRLDLSTARLLASGELPWPARAPHAHEAQPKSTSTGA